MTTTPDYDVITAAADALWKACGDQMDRLYEPEGASPSNWHDLYAIARLGHVAADLVQAARERQRAADDEPAPCFRHNAHEPHRTPAGRCPGTAPEFPSEPVERVTDAQVAGAVFAAIDLDDPW